MSILIILYLLNLIFGKKPTNTLYCGLVGFSATDFVFSKDKIAQLLLWNQERGKDATGIYTPETGVKKSLKKAEDYIADDFWNDVYEDNLFIGHVRAATVGWNNINNAHPFMYGNIVLAHNGTLDNPWILCSKLGLNSAEYDVDSQVLAASLNKEQNLKCLSKFEGAAAIMFTDTNTPDILYVYRNKERPLYRGIGEEGMYISSIEKSLKAINCRDIKEFKEDYFYTIKNGKIKNQYKIAKRPFKTITTVSRNRYWNSELEEFEREDVIEQSPIKDIVNLYTYRGKELINRWLKSDITSTSCLGKPISVKRDCWYWCVGVANTNEKGGLEEVYILDENENKVKVSCHYFNFESYYDLNLTTYVYFMKNTFYKEGNLKSNPAAKIGEIWKIIEHRVDERRLINEITGKKSVCPDDCFRPASPLEIRNHCEHLRTLRRISSKKLNMEKVKEIEESATVSLDNMIKVIEERKIGGTDLYNLTSAQILQLKEGLEALRDTLKLEFNDLLSEAKIELP